MANVVFEKLLSDECHWTLLTISQHWFRWWLGAVRQQAITWANVDLDLYYHMVLLGHNEFNFETSTLWSLFLTFIFLLHSQIHTGVIFLLRQVDTNLCFLRITLLHRVYFLQNNSSFRSVSIFPRITLLHRVYFLQNNSSFRLVSTLLWITLHSQFPTKRF